VGNKHSWTIRTCLGDGKDLEMKDIKNERKIEVGTTWNIENEKI
jgi:hypothetical protein